MSSSSATDPSSRRSRSSRKLTREEAAWVEGLQNRSIGFQRLFGIGAGILLMLLGGLGFAGGVYELFQTEWKGLLLVGIGILLAFLGFMLLVMGLISSRDTSRPLPRVRRIRGTLSQEWHGSGRTGMLRWTLQGIPFTRLLDPRWEEEFVAGETVICELVLQEWILEGSSQQGWLLGIWRNGAQPEEMPVSPEEDAVPDSSDPAADLRGSKPFPVVVQFLIATFMMSVLALVSSMWREMFPHSKVHWHFAALLLGFSALCLVPPLRPVVSPDMAWHLWQARTVEAYSPGKAGGSHVRAGDRVVIARALAVETRCSVPTVGFDLPDQGTCFVPSPSGSALENVRSELLQLGQRQAELASYPESAIDRTFEAELATSRILEAMEHFESGTSRIVLADTLPGVQPPLRIPLDGFDTASVDRWLAKVAASARRIEGMVVLDEAHGGQLVLAPRFDTASALRSWILSALLGLMAVCFPFHALLAFRRQQEEARRWGQTTP